MSGHNKWSGIKHRKEAQDNKRAAVFTKFARLITIAARDGGDATMNFKLRLAIDNARAVNMPKENIERAIKTGTGELKDGSHIEELTYEAYGPGNIALIIETTTDNKNRTVSEIKTLLTKGGGKFVPSGSVSFLFRRVGLITFDTANIPLAVLENESIDSGADDFFVSEDAFIAVTAPEDLQRVKQYFESKTLLPIDAKLGYLPVQSITVSEKDSLAFERLAETLDTHSDVQMIWNNLT